MGLFDVYNNGGNFGMTREQLMQQPSPWVDKSGNAPTQKMPFRPGMAFDDVGSQTGMVPSMNMPRPLPYGGQATSPPPPPQMPTWMQPRQPQNWQDVVAARGAQQPGIDPRQQQAMAQMMQQRQQMMAQSQMPSYPQQPMSKNVFGTNNGVNPAYVQNLRAQADAQLAARGGPQMQPQEQRAAALAQMMRQRGIASLLRRG